MLGLPHLLGVAAIVTGLTGCALLDLMLGVPPFDPDNPFPSFPIPSAQASFSTGSATLVIGDETIVLDELVGGGAMQDDFGTQVTWTNGGGWYLSYFGTPDMGFGAETHYVSLDRLFDTQHWMTDDPSRCVTTTTQADANGLVGSATCRGLEWADFFSVRSGLGYPTAIPGQPIFDADITFESH